MAADASLVAQVRRKLRVTWDDDETSARISEIAESAEQELRDLLGIPDGEAFDFSEPGAENALLLNRCWYEWEGALDEFRAAYSDAIGRCRERQMVRQYAEEEEQAGAAQ